MSPKEVQNKAMRCSRLIQFSIEAASGGRCIAQVGLGGSPGRPSRVLRLLDEEGTVKRFGNIAQAHFFLSNAYPGVAVIEAPFVRIDLEHFA